MAAAREFVEETGLQVNADELLPLIGHSEGFADLGWTRGIFRDDYFLCRVEQHELELSDMDEWERVNMSPSPLVDG